MIEHNLVKGKTIIVGCSGGADSICLAHNVLEASKGLPDTKVILLYVDHGLREIAPEEGKMVVALAEMYGAKGLVKKITVSDKGSVEEAARNARYEAFEEVYKDHNADCVMLAHTKSDQAETLVMRVLRGTGIIGLSGIQAVRGKYIRPLLDYDRKETEDYCSKHGLFYVEDPMNRDEKYTRSRIRFKWLPMMREENAKINDALSRLAKSATEVREFLDWTAENELKKYSDGTTLKITKEWKSLPTALTKHMLLLHTIKCTGNSVELKHLDTLLEFCLTEHKGEQYLQLPSLKIRSSYEYVTWNPVKEQPTPNISWPGMIKRHPEPGDRVIMNGMSKKIANIFKDKKIPKYKREVAWLFTDQENKILWVEYIGRIQ